MSHKILLVDDETFILEEVSEALTEEGYHCFAVDNVDAALEIVRSDSDISLIITDMKMPKKTGADLIKTVREEFGRNMKIIVISGSPLVEEDGFDMECYTFLRKPLDIARLIETVNQAIG